ncbi:MAG: hypothetical protein SWK90_19050, partial [Chloroflexota bacterium]|nr:hypothetical protein [Chloroflexota bacterium]
YLDTDGSGIARILGLPPSSAASWYLILYTKSAELRVRDGGSERFVQGCEPLVVLATSVPRGVAGEKNVLYRAENVL